MSRAAAARRTAQRKRAVRAALAHGSGVASQARGEVADTVRWHQAEERARREAEAKLQEERERAARDKAKVDAFAELTRQRVEARNAEKQRAKRLEQERCVLRAP